MGLNFSFFKTPKHRVFHYEPLYYDEQKEKMAERLSEIEKEKAAQEGRTWKDEKYYPGRNIRGKIRNSSEENRKHSMNASTRRIVTLVSITILFILVFLVAEKFNLLITLLD